MGRGPGLLPVCSRACPPQRPPAGTSARTQPAQEKRRNTKPAGDSGPKGLPAGAAAAPDTRPRGGPELRLLPMGRSPLPTSGRVVLTRPRPPSDGDRPLGCLRRWRGLRAGRASLSVLREGRPLCPQASCCFLLYSLLSQPFVVFRFFLLVFS